MNPLSILLTGADRGIGKAIGDALGDHRVVRHSVDAGAKLIRADFDVAGAAEAAWHEALGNLNGRVDVLINNAGIFEAAPLSLTHARWLLSWERTLRVNLTAAAELCALAVRHFLNAGGGRIINVASRAAYRGDSPDHWHYAASKGGMVAMAKTIARAYAQQNIFSYVVCPGFTSTEGTAQFIADSQGAALSDIPLGRAADPNEIGEVVRWLATEAPPSATGAVIDVNGASFVR